MVTIIITGGPTIKVNWQTGMNGQTALELAYNAQPAATNFTFMLQYYGSALGYLVDMINGTYDSFVSTEAPYFFWDFIVNENPSKTGIDNTPINDGDIITFTYTIYNPVIHDHSTIGTKFLAKA